MGLPAESVQSVFLAALLHDLGRVTRLNGNGVGERSEVDPLHAIIGARLLEVLPPLARAANIVRFHHVDYAGTRRLQAAGITVPPESAILFMADWIAREGAIDNILAEVPRFVAEAETGRGTLFDPAVVDTFETLAMTEGFWLDLFSTRLERILGKFNMPDMRLGEDDIQRMAWLFSLIIDSHSRFTATHSSGVAAASVALAECVGWRGSPVRQMGVAGFLHDIGKLLVSNSILDKQGSLSKEEWGVVRAHTFHTQRILEVVDGFEDVTQWAADHHESLNGKGYPFRKAADEIPEGSRIMAIADTFTALTEDRPYRAGLGRDKVTEILRHSVEKAAFDPHITECLLDNYALIDDRRSAAQQRRTAGLREFWDGSHAEAAHLGFHVSGRPHGALEACA